MKTKRQRKTTKKLLSMLAASAVMLSQISTSLSASAAAETQTPTQVDSTNEQNEFVLPFETIHAADNSGTDRPLYPFEQYPADDLFDDDIYEPKPIDSYEVVLEDGLYYKVYEDHAQVAYCETEDPVIRSSVNGKPVISIFRCAFQNKKIKSVYIPDTVTQIQSSAFAGTDLASIDIPDSVTEIGVFALSGMKNLTSITLPPSLTVLSRGIFKDCTSLSEIDLPASLKTIGQAAFCNCYSLKHLDLPESLDFIDVCAFADCGIDELKIPVNVKVLNCAFWDSSIPSIICDSSLTELPDRLFYYATGLRYVNLPPNLTSIPIETFYNCTSLSTVKLPENLNSISESAFNGCTSLNNIELPEGLRSIEQLAFSNTSFSDIYIPESVQRIEWNAFEESELKTIYGISGSYAERFAAENNYKFKDINDPITDEEEEEDEEKDNNEDKFDDDIEDDPEEGGWYAPTSLPTSGTYKLKCDVTLNEPIEIKDDLYLNLDLNGHKIKAESFYVYGNMTVTDSSKDQTGSVSTSGYVLFAVGGTLKLSGGSFIENLTKDEGLDPVATIIIVGDGKFVLDGAKVISKNGTPLMTFYPPFTYEDYYPDIDLISGTLESACKNKSKEPFWYSAAMLAYTDHNCNFHLRNATLKSEVGYGIFTRTPDINLNISGGRIESKNEYGIYSEYGTKAFFSGNPEIIGGKGGICVHHGGKINISGRLTGGNITIDSEDEGVFTNGYSRYNKGIAPSLFFTPAKGGRITVDGSGELTYNRKIADEEELCKWAEKNYEKTSDKTVAGSDITSTSDTEYEITIKDYNGNVLDVYNIDSASGKGKNSNDQAVDLPQTGNNSNLQLYSVLAAIFLILFGASVLIYSCLYKKKE